MTSLVQQGQLQGPGGAWEAALRYLSYRPRSEAEIRERLRRRRFPGPAIESALAQLKQLGLVDDAAFARVWVQSREASNPRSRLLLASELRQKGVDPEVIHREIAGIEEEASAYRAARKRALSLAAAQEEAFRHRLGAYLRRRGFSYELARHTVDRMWQERAIPSPEGEGSPLSSSHPALEEER